MPLLIRRLKMSFKLEIETRNRNSKSKLGIETRNRNSKSKSKLEIGKYSKIEKMAKNFWNPSREQKTVCAKESAKNMFLLFGSGEAPAIILLDSAHFLLPLTNTIVFLSDTCA